MGLIASRPACATEFEGLNFPALNWRRRHLSGWFPGTMEVAKTHRSPVGGLTHLNVLPNILEDELLAGYRGRIALMNGVQSTRQVAELMSSSHSGGLAQPHHTAAFIETAAIVNAMSVDELLRRHSYYRMVRGFDSNAVYSELDQRERVTAAKLSIRNLGRRARLCPTCAEDDLQAHKFSYWRKRHQLPGRFSCPVHGCGLLHVDDSSLIDQMPHEIVELTSGVDKANRSKFISNPHILLALDILEQLNDHHTALNRDACMAAFRTEIRAQGQEPSQPRWFSEFSASIDAAFSLEWLHAAFPRSRFKAGTIRNFAIGCISDKTILTSNLAMAVIASMLYSTARDALLAMGVNRQLRGATVSQIIGPQH